MQYQASLKRTNIGLVAIKKVINPYAKIKIKSDLSGVETQNMPFVTNPFDEVAIIEAVKLKEQGILHSIIAVSIGHDSKDILIQALARGADKAIFIKTEQSMMLTPLNVAKILQYLVLENQVNMVFLGKQAIDDDSNQTGQMLAGLLNWPQGCFVAKITPNFLMSNLQIVREIDTGIEILDISLPAVITMELQYNEPKYLSVAQLMQAKKKPLDLILLEQLLIHLKNFNTDNIQILTTTSPPILPIGIRIQTAAELIKQLQTKDKVL